MSEEPSSPDLVELSRRRLAAVNRRDIDAVMSFFAADPVWDMSPINMGIFEGRADQDHSVVTDQQSVVVGERGRDELSLDRRLQAVLEVQ